jgi:hypothetical protein
MVNALEKISPSLQNVSTWGVFALEYGGILSPRCWSVMKIRILGRFMERSFIRIKVSHAYYLLF